MKFNIYDYKNDPYKIDTGNKQIDTINVLVLSGDEIVTITYTDGSVERYDSSSNRLIDYFDDQYVVTGKELEEWLSYKPDGNDTISYKRAL